MGSVTAASHELRLAQPTISAQIKILEEQLGERLFVRQGRNIHLTEVGVLALKYADEAFSACQEFLGILDGQRSPRRKLTIGISDVVPKLIAYRLIEPALSGPDASSITCYEDRTQRLLAELAMSEVDLVISDSPVPSSVKVRAFNHLLGQCGVTFLAPRKLMGSLNGKFPDCLTGAPLLVPTTEAALRRELDHWVDTKQIKPYVVGEFQDSALMKLVAREGQGIIPVPSVIEPEVRREFRLEVVGRTEEIIERFYLISIEKRLKNPAVKNIVERAQSNIFSRRTKQPTRKH